MRDQNKVVAYFSLEIGLEAHIPTYSGGLGVLAGDTLRAAADLGMPHVGVTLLYRDGYFKQRLGPGGMQIEEPTKWEPEKFLQEMPQRVHVPIEGRTVIVRAYRLILTGVGGRHVPIYYLDTDLPENTPQDRQITRALYAGDTDHRIKQEAVLGIAGRRMLRALTHDVATFHMNEGHACFLIIELVSEYLSRFDKHDVDSEAIRHAKARCVFTTHTPVEAGHDRFSIDRVKAIIGDHPVFNRPDLYGKPGELNTTVLALNFTRYANGVARKHGEVSRAMFPGRDIQSVTNGIHAASWTGQPLRELFDKYYPEWRASNSELRLAKGLPGDELWAAHQTSKKQMIAAIAEKTGTQLDPEVFTIGFARRSTAYKRPAMLVSDLERLRAMSKNIGKVQIVYAGKAHPHDGRGKEIIKQIHGAIAELKGWLNVVFVPDYDIELARKYVAGVDLWLNTPEPPLEASGTSGMKAAINGVPSLSTMDGWWIEGCVEGATGWGIGKAGDLISTSGGDNHAAMFQAHAEELYWKLENQIVPMYYRDRAKWLEVMRSCIGINGAYFTTERMLRDYIVNAYYE